jgi:hypothetical protein
MVKGRGTFGIIISRKISATAVIWIQIFWHLDIL